MVVSAIYLLENADHSTKIVFCNVGEGSAVYFRVRNRIDLLVNSGPDKKIIECLSKHMPFFDREIEYLMLLSMSQNYSKGVLTVLSRYKIKNMYIPKDYKDTKTTDEIKDTLDKLLIPVSVVDDVRRLSILDSITNVIPISNNYQYFSLEEDGRKVILMGHLPARIASEIKDESARIYLEDAHLLQLPVYGFKSKLNRDPVSLADPTNVVITAQNKLFKAEALDSMKARLEALKIPYWVSNQKEDIQFTLN